MIAQGESLGTRRTHHLIHTEVSNIISLLETLHDLRRVLRIINLILMLYIHIGLSEWEDDRVLAAVLAASQQEYLQGLKQNSRGAESL